MASNYSSDPKNILPVSNLQQGPGSVPSGPYATPSTEQPEGGHHRRLAPGVELSGARYKIEKLVAAGGMGAVYKTLDTRFNRPCAVKEMLDEFNSETERAQAVEWFSREATLLLDLNHPCIPRVRDFFAEGGRHYLVMDFIEGRTLAEVLDQDGNVLGLNGAQGIVEARARSWAQQVCSVLGYLHRQTPPIIFRDLKPSNIMVTDRDEIKLIDFGIARTFQSQRQSTVIMTIGYAPPEQLHGMPEPRSDLYALGATLHRLLTRHDAVNNKPNIFSFPPLRSLRPDLSPAFEQVIMKALSPALEGRWPSATDMERALINLPPVTVNPPIVPLGGQPGQRIGNSQAPYTPASGGSGSNISVGQATTGTTGPGGPHIITASGHLTAGRIEAAYEAIKVAHGFEPNNSLVHKLFGQVFARRVPPQPDLALQAYNRSLRLNAEDAETHKLVGDVLLFIRQQPQSAISAYIQSLRLNPGEADTHYCLGQCYEQTGQFELALREFQEAVHLAPKQSPQPAMYYALGRLAMRMNQLQVAEQAFVQVLFINPADHQTRFLLSQVYEQENKLEDAFRECSYVAGPLSNNTAVQQMYQRLRARLGR